MRDNGHIDVSEIEFLLLEICNNYYCVAFCTIFPWNIIENFCETKKNYLLSQKSLHKLRINPTYFLDSLLKGFGIIKSFYC